MCAIGTSGSIILTSFFNQIELRKKKCLFTVQFKIMFAQRNTPYTALIIFNNTM